MAAFYPFFWSEAQFQLVLALELLKAECTRVELEHPAVVATKASPGSPTTIKIDIVAKYNGKWYPIELKYKTALLSAANMFGQPAGLKNEGAQDIGRYQIWEDVDRIESLKTAGICNDGYVVFLTNDAAYWNPKASLTIDSKFKDFTATNRNIIWTPTSKTHYVTPAGYKSPKSTFPNFVLSKVYGPFHWNHYSLISGQKNGEFKYIIIDI